MRRVLLLCVFVAIFAIAGCSREPSKNPDDYVGEYVLLPSTVAAGPQASFIVLKKDRTAFEMTFVRSTGQVTTGEVPWYLQRGTDQELVIDKRSYPVERTGAVVKLVVNGDLGQRYEKVR